LNIQIYVLIIQFEIGVLCGSLIRKRSHRDDEAANDHNDQPPATQP